jgi:RND family efflux transporter MFP subunit
VRINIAIPQPEVPFIERGLPVAVALEELPGRTFEGTITRFAYAMDDATKTMRAEIELPNPDLALRPGTYARVTITLERRPDALVVPAEALVTEKEKSFVFTCQDERAKMVAVKTGSHDGIRVEILEGLSPADRVILAGKQSLSDGQAVRAVEVP